MRTADLYKSVTAGILADLERGVAPWVKPWTSGNAGSVMPVNFVTKRHYSGINIPILWDAQIRRGYPTAEWMTYKQALPVEAHVRKGETGITVVFTKRINVKNDDEDGDRRIAMLRTYTVFNVAQIDGLPAESPPAQSTPTADTTMLFIGATKADIRHGGDRACYVPSKDLIMLPPESAFTGREHYLATVLHELVHFSGHPSRLDRQLGNRFGSAAYAAEELIAELGAAFLCALLGIKGKLRHAEYIGSWIKLLTNDAKAIFTAASKASQAADYLRSFSEVVDEPA